MPGTCFASEWLWRPLLALLAQPILLGELALLSGILVFSVGKQLGAPLQFFHERWGYQAWAGLTATLAAAHIFFVIYLTEAKSSDELQKPLAAWFLGLWLLVVLTASGIRLISKHAPSRIGHGLKLSPRLRDVRAAPGAASEGAAGFPEVSPLPFLGGVVAGLLLLTAGVGVLRASLPALDQLAKSTMSWLGRSTEPHPGLHLVALLLTVFVAAQLLLLHARASAAGALCSLLVLVSTIIGAGNYWFGASTVVTLILLLLAAVAGRERYAVRIADLGKFYKKAARFRYPPDLTKQQNHDASLADCLVTAGATPPAWPARDNLPVKRPLILVCTSGGGIRAATWTAGLLARLEQDVPHFPQLTLMITGASGGMVGAAFWVANLKRVAEGGASLGPDKLTRLVSQDSLTAICRALVLNDLPDAIRGGVNRADRGAMMQQSWQVAAKSAEIQLAVPLTSFAEGERQRRWPSLVFSPMIVEDGRRLLISNLRLQSVVESQALWLEDFESQVQRPASHSAFHVRDIFGDHSHGLTLATAARLSASFPYISPAVVLPTQPRTRVVDAGYYDNFGVDLATGFLREALEIHSEWLDENVSSILIVQIRDDESSLGEGPGGVPQPLPSRGKGFFGSLSRGLEGLSSPLEGFVAARGSVMQLRNDAQLDTMAHAYRTRFKREFLTQEIFELKGDVSLSWYLSEAEYQMISSQVEAVKAKVDKIASWVARSMS